MKVDASRFRFYREHKYVIDKLIDFQHTIAKTDFKATNQLIDLKEEFSRLVSLIECHAEHENKAVLELLRVKDSLIAEHCEKEHEKQHVLFIELIESLDEMIESTNVKDRINLGYSFYLEYVQFFGDSLKHMCAEEIIIMTELQKLYTDEELRAVEYNTYSIMNAVEIEHMIKELFPHLDVNDKESFLTDMNNSFPEKLAEAWEPVKSVFPSDEYVFFTNKFNIKPIKRSSNEEATLYYKWEKKPVGASEVVLTQHQRLHYNKDIHGSKEEFLEQYYN